MSRFVALLVALAAGGLVSGCASAVLDPVLDPVQADAFVAAHNERRAAASPTPTPALAPVTFDNDLSQIAQAWSARCVFEHSKEKLGENLAFFSGASSIPQDVVAIWADEDAFYDHTTNACQAGQVCGHYTQVVWRGTTRIGCGVSTCTIDGFQGLFWVCNYDPPGNYVGERPY